MSKGLIATTFVLAVAILSPIARSQDVPPQSGTSTGQRTDETQWAAHDSVPPDVDGWGRTIVPPAKDHKSAAAPRHDISGIWDPGDGGIQALGAAAIPDDGKPGHRLEYTPAGLEALKRTKPSNGTRSVLPSETDDPVVTGDPQGFPREDLYELRTTEIVQTPLKTIILYEFGKVWRGIWTDGREFPKDPEPRWYGYSVGKWVDDYTFVVDTWGLDDRSWIDHTGRPHSEDLRVEERFHRVDHDHLELTVTINDPQMYVKPWMALDKLSFNLEPTSFDIREMIWAPSEFRDYNNLIGGRTSAPDGK
jgi:hypothetical protein